MKKVGFHIPVLAAVAVLLLVLYIVTRADTSPVAKFTQWYSNLMEGFAAPIGDVPRCPTGYRFFNDKRGDSFCCAGSINPFTHMCEAKGANQLCAFDDNRKDPRNPNETLQSCTKMLSNQVIQAKTNLCPGKYPNYASIGKCCLNDTDLDGHNCTALDVSPANYCVTGQNVKPGEQQCKSLQMDESAKCPTGLQKQTYVMGAKEAKKYGAVANGVRIPVCFGMESSCIPNNVIESVQQQGIFSDKTNLDGWKYSCSGYERVYEQRDLTGTMDTTYV